MKYSTTTNLCNEKNICIIIIELHKKSQNKKELFHNQTERNHMRYV
jgi:hypothetical protein